MTDRLRVDLGQLRETGHRLGALRQELDRAGDQSDQVGDALGHGGLADAVHDFATNWKYHRQKLGAALDAVGRMATDSATTYQQTDEELAAALSRSQRDTAAGAAR